jgi:hypothetical protein
MISLVDDRLRLAVEVEFDRLDCESAHLVGEAKSVGTRGRRLNLVESFFSPFKEQLGPDDLTSILDLQREKSVGKTMRTSVTEVRVKRGL